MDLRIRYIALLAVTFALLAIPARIVPAEGAGDRDKGRADAIVSTADVDEGNRCPICLDFQYKHNNPLFSHKCVQFDPNMRGRTEGRKVICPVCNQIIDVEFVRQMDFTGGVDTDFCFHTLKQGEYTTNVWTCMHCAYTAYADGFYELPPGRAMVDPELQQVVDNHFRLPRSFVEWVKKDLTGPFHDEMTRLARAVVATEDWTAIKTQDAIPVDIKLKMLLASYSKLGVSYEFMSGLYQRCYYIYRRRFCASSITSDLQRGYLLTAPLLFEKESFENEAMLLEDLGKLKLGELAYTLGIKWAEYTPEQLVDKFIGYIELVNSLLAGTASPEDTHRARVWGVTRDDLNCAKFVLLLELASALMRSGDKANCLKVIADKALPLAQSGEMFTSLPEKLDEEGKKDGKATRGAAIERTLKIVQSKLSDFVNHYKYMTECQKCLKETIKNMGLRAVYYPTQSYLVGNLYYRLELFGPAKAWFGMARRSSVIYEYLGLPQNVREGFLRMVETALAQPLVSSAPDPTVENLVDLDYLEVVAMKIDEYDTAKEEIGARPHECRTFLQHIWKVLSLYQVQNSSFPPSLDALAKMGLIDAEIHNDFKCPVTGKRYGYTAPNLARPHTIYPLVYDEHVHDDETGILGYILYSDGTIKEIVSRQYVPIYGPMPEE